MGDAIQVFAVRGQVGNVSFEEMLESIGGTHASSRMDEPLNNSELARLQASMARRSPEPAPDRSPVMLGKFSGRQSLRQALREMELEIDPDTLNRIFKRFKEDAEHKSAFTAYEVEALAVECMGIGAPQYVLGYIEANETTEATTEVQVCVHRPDGSAARGSDTQSCAATAICGAINRASGIRATLQSFRHDVTDGEVLANVSVCGHVQTGRSVAGDFNEALAAAYLHGLSAAVHRARQEVMGMP